MPANYGVFWPQPPSRGPWPDAPEFVLMKRGWFPAPTATEHECAVTRRALAQVIALPTPAWANCQSRIGELPIAIESRVARYGTFLARTTQHRDAVLEPLRHERCSGVSTP